MIGRTVSKETKKRLSTANKGQFQPNKGKTNVEIYGVEKANEISRKLSAALKGKKRS
jgi:hypothetical protein